MTFVGILIFIRMISVGILTCIIMIYTTSDSLKARKVSSFPHFSFLAVEISCSVELSMKTV